MTRIRFLSTDQETVESGLALRSEGLRHAFFALIGIRPIAAQHSRAEHEALRHWAKNRRSIVEIGVAEGASALALRESMAWDGMLVLIDPFHLSRIPRLNLTKRLAHRAVASCPRGHTTWIQAFSSDAAQSWRGTIDLLFIDGDHRAIAVEKDWLDWSPSVVPGGLVIFHDARVFAGGWTSAEYGPVKLVDRLFRSRPISGWKIVGEVDSLVAVERTNNSMEDLRRKCALP